MRKRSLSRTFALQVLYQVDIAGVQPDAALEAFWKMDEHLDAEEDVRQFCAELVRGACEHRAMLDDQDGCKSQ